jgi:hypothetical protein
MHQLRRLSLTVLVWLTAAMTLVAGTPHFTCRCPNGQVKSICLGLSSKKSTCCCNGGCCAHGQEGGTACCCAQDAPAGCCCSQHAGQGPVKPEKAGAFTGSACCKRTLASQDPQSLSPAKAKVAKNVSFGLLAPDGDPGPSFVTAIHRPRQHHERPPPTDLVITLHHFLI